MQTMIDTLNDLAGECYRLCELLPNTEENRTLKFRLYLLDDATRNHAHDLECLLYGPLRHDVNDSLYWTQYKLDAIIRLKGKQ